LRSVDVESLVDGFSFGDRCVGLGGVNTAAGSFEDAADFIQRRFWNGATAADEITQVIAEAAFALARQRRNKVTAVHKANVLRVSDGLFLECTRAVAAREETDDENPQDEDTARALLNKQRIGDALELAHGNPEAS
jgi:hypothetical protein